MIKLIYSVILCIKTQLKSNLNRARLKILSLRYAKLVSMNALDKKKYEDTPRLISDNLRSTFLPAYL